ncbi:hypothetical protein ACE6H2_017821 [Prunus campanulata]
MLGEEVQPAYADLNTELRPTAPPKVLPIPIIKSRFGPIGEDKEQGKKLVKGSLNGAVAPPNGCENGGVLKSSRERTSGGHGNNGKPTIDLNTSPEGGSGHNGKQTTDLKISPEVGNGLNGKLDGGATQDFKPTKYLKKLFQNHLENSIFSNPLVTPVPQSFPH